MKKIYYRKLIRDKIPEKILRKGSALKSHQLSAKEFEYELLKKVGEEASGLLNARNKKELVAELADILDVIDEIKKLKKISSTEVAKAQKENAQTKSGFKKRLFLVWSSDGDYKTNERKGFGR